MSKNSIHANLFALKGWILWMHKKYPHLKISQKKRESKFLEK